MDDPTTASRYLAGQLSEAESEAYEAQFATDPGALAELEATARLKIGLQRLRRTGELSGLLAASGSHPPNRTWVFAMAAGVAAAVIGMSVWFPRTPDVTSPVLAPAASAFKDRSGHGLSVSATAALFRTRAEKYDAIIEVPGTRGAIRLRVLPSNPSETARYQASLAPLHDDNTVAKGVIVDDLRPSSDDGFVDVFADSALLTPGRYQLRLTRETGGAVSGESDAFVIKVNRAH